MDKPVTLLQREFQDKLVDLINNSCLPAFVLEPILEQALNRVSELAEERYQLDLAEYRKEQQTDGKTTET